MNILILNSSYRKDGNTDRTAQLLQARLESTAKDNHEPLVLDTFYLGHMNVEPCRGCRVCFDKGEEFCPIKDDMADIKARVKAADAIILAGPVYVDDVNGIMKNWIDRLAHVCHRPEFAGKSAYLLATAGSTRTGHALRTMDTALRTWGF
jgi:multimeric flavodoxin WrbA